MKHHGDEPEIAHGSEDAVRLALTKRYDALLFDLHLPDRDGFAATQRIRAAETGDRRTPIIALTAAIAEGTREKCLAAGMDEHLTTPLDLKKFKTMRGNFMAITQPAAPSVQPAVTVAAQI